MSALWAGQTSLLGRIRVRASAMCPRSGPLRHWLGLVCGLLGPLAPSLRRPLPPPRPAPPQASLGHPQPDLVSRGNGPGQVGAHAQLGATPDCRPSPT